MLFAFIVIDRPDSAELRDRLRADHIEYMLRVKDRTVFGGPLLDGDGKTLGSILAADFKSRDAAEAFIAEEPYTKGGLFESVVIRRWKAMVPEPHEGFLQEELERQKAKRGGSR